MLQVVSLVGSFFLSLILEMLFLTFQSPVINLQDSQTPLFTVWISSYLYLSLRYAINTMPLIFIYTFPLKNFGDD
jgi:hypothetical protein